MTIDFRCRLSLAICTLLLPVSPAFAENYGHIPDSRVYLGAGFSPLQPDRNFPLCIASKGECQTTANGAVACIGGTAAPSEQEPLGIGTTFKVKQIESKYEFFREVNIQASLSGSYGPFSGSGSFSSFSLDDIKEDSLTWIVAAKSAYGSFALIDPSLNSSARGLKPLDLIGKCGSSYVSAIDRGVMAAAIFSVYNLDEKHRREIRASMSAGFSTGVFDISGNAKFSDVMRTALQYGTMNINVYALGGKGAPELADAIKANPTDLDKIKETLSNYVKNQDSKHAAIVGFQTTGLGKLVGNPSIDPDQSNYVFYLEGANEFRLSLIGAVRQVDWILERQSDFDPGVVSKARELRERLVCELRIVETGMKSCRMSYELTSYVQLDGDASDDQAASFAQRYGVSGSTISKRMQICPLSESAVGEVDSSAARRPVSPRALVTMGWLRESAVGGVEVAPLTAPPKCTVRLRRSENRLGEMIRVALDANENNRRRGANTAANIKPVCISGCDFPLNREIISEIASLLPKFPFETRYWFDSLGANFSSKTDPGLYVQLEKAGNVSEIRAYNDQDAMPFGIRINSGNTSVSLFFDEKGMAANQAPVRLEVETLNGNLYTVLLPKIKLL
ncbi:hypothetical protein ABIF66_001807 [Bradyrhizobium japonicum]